MENTALITGISVNILFICTANICRSPMAEGYLRHLCTKNNMPASIKSAGTHAYDGEPVSENSARVLSEIGIDISSHLSSRLRREMLDRADKVIVMSKSHMEAILQRFDSEKITDKIFLLNSFAGSGTDIFDPFRGDIDCYRKCFDEIRKAVDKLYEVIKG